MATIFDFLSSNEELLDNIRNIILNTNLSLPDIRRSYKSSNGLNYDIIYNKDSKAYQNAYDAYLNSLDYLYDPASGEPDYFDELEAFNNFDYLKWQTDQANAEIKKKSPWLGEENLLAALERNGKNGFLNLPTKLLKDIYTSPLKTTDDFLNQADRVIKDVIVNPGEINEVSWNETKKNSNFFNKTINFLGKNADIIGAGADIGSNLFDTLGSSDMYEGPKGHTGLAILSVYDSTSDAAMKLYPALGAAMKGVNALNKLQNLITGGTDNMTTFDSIMNTPLGFITGLGWANAAFGKKSDTFTKNDEVFADAGNSLTGLNMQADNVVEIANKKYGAFSNGSRIDANRRIMDMLGKMNIAELNVDIANTRRALRDSMTAINNLRIAYGTNSSINRMLAGKYGMKLFEKVHEIVKKHKLGGILSKSYIKEVELKPTFQEGGSIKEIELTPIKEINSSELNLTNKTRTLEELIEYAKLLNPRFILRMSEPVRDIDLGNGFRGTHRLSWRNTDNPNKAIVYPEIFENENGELIYDPEHAYDNAKKGDALFMTPEEAEIFTKGYKQGWPDFFLKFEKGGKFNVIPEGALHARLHHMNIEGITNKGIPVVSEDNGKIEQHAEVERAEIILRLSVTEKLEKLQKLYEETKDDKYAIEAGELLVHEILYNTLDNTK